MNELEEGMDPRYTLILFAGNSESASMMAMDDIREGNFESASQQIDTAKTELRKAHQLQTQLLQNEARGEKMPIDILMVHAQDHFSMASILVNMAEESCRLNQKIKELENRL